MAKRIAKPKLKVQYRNGTQFYVDQHGKQYSMLEGKGLLLQNKATMVTWKGGKSQKETYEGTQYRGGRKPGKKNLIKTETGFRNQHGVEFTAEQKKALERAVNKSNYIHNKMVKQEANLPRTPGGVETGDTVGQLHKMGSQSDFIITRQSKSLQNFHSMEEFERYMDKQARIHSGEYLDDMTRLYKRNHMQALENVFGDDAKDVIMKIRMMKPEKYREMIQKDEFLEVQYIYDPSARQGKLNQIRHSLGMKIKEQEFDELE